MKEVKKKAIKKIDSGLQLVQYGSVIFGIGLLIVIISALVAGFSSLGSTFSQIIAVTLIILGIIIGIVNITKSEAIGFLVAAIALVILIGPFLSTVVQTFQLGQTSSQVLGELFQNTVRLIAAAEKGSGGEG